MIAKPLLLFSILLAGLRLCAQDLQLYRTEWFNPALSAHTYCNPMDIEYTL